MKNLLKVFGIIALVAVMGFAFVSCGEEDPGKGNNGGNGNGGGSGGKSYKIGDYGPAGGIIFYVSEEGFTMTGIAGTCHYLEVSMFDLYSGGGRMWTTATYAPFPAINGTLETIGSGKNNTAIIIAAESAEYPDEIYPYAARACSEYGGVANKDDWFLPSKDELNELYKAKEKLVISSSHQRFWSSSQVDDNRAWAHEFVDGSQVESYKTGVFSLRAVRAF